MIHLPRLPRLRPLPFFFFFFFGTALWVHAIAPRLLWLPEDFHYSAQTVSTDNFYAEGKGDYAGVQASIGKFSYDVVGKEDGVLLVRNAFDVRKTNGENVFSIEREYAIDRRSGMHADGHGDRDRSGYLFGPGTVDKGDFTYWHVNYDSPALLEFKSEEKIEGLTVYRYQANYHADQTATLGHLMQVGKTRGVNLDINLQVWIEPLSGWMVKYADQSTAYYYDLASGKRLFPWNHFSNTFSADSVTQQVAMARAKRARVLVLRYVVPYALGLLALAILSLRILRGMRLRRFMTTRSVLCFLIAAIPLASGMGLWHYTRVGVEQNALNKFHQEISGVQWAIARRIEVYKNALEGARALFGASQEVTREEWRRYAAALELEKNYPGIRNVAFAQVVPSAQADAFVIRMRKEGLEEYAITPTGKREEYAPITYIEPPDQRNGSILGLDMLAADPRREAMLAARDANTTVMSGKLAPLVVDAEQLTQAAFHLYVPVYRNGAAISTPQERRAAIMGYVFGGARVNRFIEALFHGTDLGVHFEIYDGSGEGVINDEHLIYSSLPRTKLLSSPRFQVVETLDLIGHPWTIVFRTVPGYGIGTFEEHIPVMILTGCLLFSILMIFAMLLVRRTVRNTMVGKCPLITDGNTKQTPCRPYES